MEVRGGGRIGGGRVSKGWGGAIIIAFGMSEFITNGAVEEFKAVTMERGEAMGTVIGQGIDSIIDRISKISNLGGILAYEGNKAVIGEGDSTLTLG